MEDLCLPVERNQLVCSVVQEFIGARGLLFLSLGRYFLTVGRVAAGSKLWLTFDLTAS